MEKKKSEKTVMDKTIEDNLLHKKVLEEETRKEKEDDIRIMEDVTVLNIKNENKRKEYFTKIERNENVFTRKAVESVLKANKLKYE